MPQPDIGAMIAQFIEEKKINKLSLSKKFGVSYGTTIKRVQNQSMQIKTLYEISEILGHNFIAEAAKSLPPLETEVNIPELEAKIAAQNALINDLEIQVRVLERAITLLNGK